MYESTRLLFAVTISDLTESPAIKLVTLEEKRIQRTIDVISCDMREGVKRS